MHSIFSNIEESIKVAGSQRSRLFLIFKTGSTSKCHNALSFDFIPHKLICCITLEVNILKLYSEGRKASHNIFSSEPPRNPRPSNIIFLKCSILQVKIFFKNPVTLEHKQNIKFLLIRRNTFSRI